MRLATALAALALSSFPATQALADTFTFTPTGGSAFTFSTTGLSPTYVSTNSPSNVFVFAPAGTQSVYFYGDSMANAYKAFGYGHFDIEINFNGLSYFEDGPQLFAGSQASYTPTFNAGTYSLAGDPNASGIGGTLVIVNDAPVAAPTPAAAVTPEPSSFALMGTGLLGFAGLVRRRMTSGARA